MRSSRQPARVAGTEGEVATSTGASISSNADREHEYQVRAGLQDFDGVEMLAIDRTVEWPVSGIERENKRQAEAQARRLLG